MILEISGDSYPLPDLESQCMTAGSTVLDVYVMWRPDNNVSRERLPLSALKVNILPILSPVSRVLKALY